VTLAAIWGASYLFMRIAVPHVGSQMVVEGRTLTGGLVMAAYLAATRTPLALARHWRGYLVIGVVGVALPVWLVGVAVKSIDASTAAILNATTPVFVAVFASIGMHESLDAEKILGIALSITGIAVLVGWTPRPLTLPETVSCALVLASSACYGFVSVYTKMRMSDAPAASLSTANCLVAAAVMAPLTAWPAETAPVPASAWLSIVALGVLCTAIAFILLYRLIADVGPVRTSTVSLLIPVFGMLWGALFLGEPVTPGRLAGCATVLAGCVLALGLFRLPLRRGLG